MSSCCQQAPATGSHVIIGVHVPHRAEHALQVQGVLTKYGKCIKTRLGLHDPEHDSGVILLEMLPCQCYGEFETQLSAAGATIQRMTFAH
eukprot:m51a1_g10532 hypothetical protein (90) ;mRNA; f:243520-243994